MVNKVARLDCFHDYSYNVKIKMGVLSSMLSQENYFLITNLEHTVYTQIVTFLQYKLALIMLPD